MTTALAKAVEAARDADPHTRQEVALRLGATPDDAGLADHLLAWFLTEDDPFVLETLTWGVVFHRASSTRLLVQELKRAGAPAERILHALSKIEDPRTVPAILPHAQSPDEQVAGKAWWALARIAEEGALPALLAHLGVEGAARDSLAGALVQWGPAVLPALVTALDDPSPAVRTHATELVVRVLNPETRGMAARRDDQDARLAAARSALATVQTDEAPRVLRQLAEDAQEGVARVAREILLARAP